MGNHAVGSVWRRWDLHVHTPASVVQRYGGDTDIIWEKFVKNLEQLPSEFAVIGVNDYLFLDGYRKLRQFKSQGRLKNIETLLPVIEFRLAKFAGNEKMLRLNFHVIFSEQLDPDVIESQFLVQLRSKLTVSAEYARVGKQWAANATKQSLTDLGALIRATIPGDRRFEFAESDFILGFNNVNFDDERLRELLDNSYLRGKFLTAIGKTEWDQYKWNDHSIADKKNVIESADIVFIAAADQGAFIRAQQKLKAESVNHRLFDCSDAHSFSDTKDKDRIGNCLTWIKADPTLDGLIMAAREYTDRVLVENRPAVLDAIDRAPGRFIRQLSIKRRKGTQAQGTWFDDVHLPLNPELVAVIGNRGMGKSALLDAIALSGNSSRPTNELSFLGRFRSTKGNLAANFEVQLDWHSDEPSVVAMDNDYDPRLPSRVKHLPQNFIEIVCNEEDDKFEDEIERVVFSHVPDDERLGRKSMSELIDYRSNSIEHRRTALRSEISKLNQQIVAIESYANPENIARIQHELDQKLAELRARWSKRPRFAPVSGTSDPKLVARLKELRQTHEKLQKEKEEKESRRRLVRAALESARRLQTMFGKLDGVLKQIATEYKPDIDRLGLLFEDLIFFNFDHAKVAEIEAGFEIELNQIRDYLDSTGSGSFSVRIESTRLALQAAENELSAPMLAYQQTKNAYGQFRVSIRESIGSPKVSDSIRGLQSRLNYLHGEAPEELVNLEARRFDATQRLFQTKLDEAELYKELYKPVQTFVNAHPPEDGNFKVEFNASIEAVGFEAGFFGLVAHNKKGTYYGREQAVITLGSLWRPVDFNEWSSVREFLRLIVESLRFDFRPGEGRGARQPANQLLSGKTLLGLYDFLFGLEYVAPKHRLTMGGRPLQQLSPGEKGALLLVFYLLVDQSDCPLLVDQPEENLDNQSVFSVLVPFIREARKRRQVILVTHNPNIAVVSGAEQVIFCEIDKAHGFKVKYESGALENRQMNRHVVDVLEGTRPAFSDRELKYRVSANS